MKKMTTDEKLNKCIDFLKMFNEYEFYYTFDFSREKVYYASDVDEMKDRIWHLLVDISD